MTASERSRADRLEQDLERLRAECSVCEACGQVQAEPNWCHKCRHRVTMPEWAGTLIDQHNAMKDALLTIVEQDPVELALDPQWPQRIAESALDRLLASVEENPT